MIESSPCYLVLLLLDDLEVDALNPEEKSAGLFHPHSMSDIWEKEEKKKINSAPSLIKSAPSRWQNAMREKLRLTLAF